MAVAQRLEVVRHRPVEERRAWVREPVNQPALILTGGGRQIEARISDFCPGGMYLRPRRVEQAKDIASLKAGESLRVFFRPSSGEQRYHVCAEVARSNSVGAGLKFGKPHKPFYRVLHRVAEQQSATRVDTSVTRFDRRPLLKNLSDRASMVMTSLMEEFVATAQIKLLHRSDAEYHDEDQVALKNAAQVLRSLDRGLITMVPAWVSRAMRTPVPSAPMTSAMPAPDESPLELVDESQFDYWMTVSELAAKGEGRFPVQIFELRHRLSLLFGEAVDRESNPVSPLNIVQAFTRALHTLPLSVVSLHSIYSAFDSTVISGLGRLYDQLNQDLVAAGVAPVVSHGMPNWMPE